MEQTKKNAFTCDDIHELRIKTAERYSRMTPEEVKRDFKSRVEEGKKIMDAIRKTKQAQCDE